MGICLLACGSRWVSRSQATNIPNWGKYGNQPWSLSPLENGVTSMSPSLEFVGPRATQESTPPAAHVTVYSDVMLSPVCLDAEPRPLSRWVPTVPCPFYQASHLQESIVQGQIPAVQSCLFSSRWGLHSTRAFKGPESHLPHLAIHGGPQGLRTEAEKARSLKGRSQNTGGP